MDAHPNPPRWVADPTGRHQYRYWDGEQWTDHVADNGVTSSEPVTASGPVPVIHGYPAQVTSTGAIAAPWQADPTRVLGRRYGAFLIDALVISIVTVSLFLAYATRVSQAEGLADGSCRTTGDGSSVVCDLPFSIASNHDVYEVQGNDRVWFLGLVGVFELLYFCVMEGLTGATLGKLATGVRVVRRDGTTAGVPRAFVRSVLLVVDALPAFFLCGIISSSVSRGHRRVGDMVAGTYVIAKERVGEPVIV